MLDHLVDLAGVKADALGFSFEPFGGLQLGHRCHIGFQCDSQFFAGIKGIEQLFEAIGEIRLAEGFDFFLFNRFTPDAIHHAFQRSGTDA